MYMYKKNYAGGGFVLTPLELRHYYEHLNDSKNIITMIHILETWNNKEDHGMT